MDDQARLALLAKLNEILGPEHASTLMASIPPKDWNQLATKDDLGILGHQLEAKMHREFTRQTRIYVLAIVSTVVAQAGVTITSVALVAG
jgi:hypothetical protein